MAGVTGVTTTSTGRALPPVLWDEAAEQAVLGAMLLSSSAVSAVTAILDAADYYLPTNGVIHAAIVKLTAADSPVDTVTVSGKVDLPEGYVQSLVDYCPAVANAAVYARTVRDLSLARAVARVGMEIAELAESRKLDVRGLIDEAERKVLSISPPSEAQCMSSIATIATRIAEDLGQGKPAKCWHTGFEAVDDLLGGLHPQSFIVIGARPGLGKTAWALNIARAVAHQGPVLFFSLEMSDEEVGERFLSAAASVRLRDLRERKISDEKLADIYAAIGKADSLGLEIIWDPRTTLASLKSIARRRRAKGGLALIVIDYLQLMHTGERAESRWAEVTTISRELKVLARELEVPVLALSQLNREQDSHWSDGKPKLSQLRESGAIEQDADAVLLLSWPKDKKGVVLVNVAKNRHGPLGEVELTWQPQYMRFH